jgi:hypothetical protein
MAQNKDSEEVVRFLGGFQRLREMIDDDPVGLEALAADDEPLKQLCLAVGWAARLSVVLNRALD